LRQQFREEAAKSRCLPARTTALADFRGRAWRRFAGACYLTERSADDASAALRKIRGSIAQTRDSIQKALKQILRARNAEAGEDYVTLRNDRFVIPVRAENRRSVPGIVHGSSGTGQTVFLEPFETVEDEQSAGAACGRGSCGNCADPARVNRSACRDCVFR